MLFGIEDAGVTDSDYSQLGFFAGASRFGAAVALGEFFHAPGGIDEFLLAGEKRVASSANTDLNILAGRAGVIHRAARAHDIGLVILWMNACFHYQKRAPNVIAQTALCKR